MAILVILRLKYEITGLLFLAGLIYLYTPDINAKQLELNHENNTITIKGITYNLSDFQFFKTKIEKRAIRFVTNDNKKIKINALSYGDDLGDLIALLMNHHSKTSLDHYINELEENNL